MHPFQMASEENVATECKTRRELADLFLRQVPLACATHLLFAVVIARLVDQQLDRHRIWLWLSMLSLVALARMAGAVWDRRQLAHADLNKLKRIEAVHCLLAALIGMAWGMLPWAATLQAGPILDTMFIAIIMGFIGGGISSMAPFSLAFPLFAGFAMLPHAIKHMLVPDSFIHLIGWVTISSGTLAIIHFNRQTHRVLVRSVQLRMENERLLEALRREKEAVEEASRAKSLFLAGVSHDLKHPLNAMGLYLGYLKAQNWSAHEPFLRALPGLEQALKAMGNQLSRLLELSRLEAGEYHPKIEHVVVQDLFRAAAAQFSAKAAAKNIRLRFVATEAVVQGDRSILQSIVDNLVSNAVRYTHEGGVLVGLRHRAQRPLLQVSDTGIGMPEAQLPLLFNAYRRFDDTRAGHEGHGLGLALVKKQCDLAGYTITLRSVPGQGSTFTVMLAEHPPST